MDHEDLRTVEMPALGQPFALGMLYDCSSDSVVSVQPRPPGRVLCVVAVAGVLLVLLICGAFTSAPHVSGITLWDDDDLKRHVRERPQRFNTFEMDASASNQDRFSALDVHGSLKASFLLGLITAEGAAKYLEHEKTFQNQCKLTLSYKVTTRVQELSMDHLGQNNLKHKEQLEQSSATHVVTAILYGAQAFFVFEREASDNESLKDLQGRINAQVLGLKFNASMKTTSNVKESAEKIACTFYGDFNLKKTPRTFQDAIHVYQSLPSLLGPNGENAVPIKVWMLPLRSLNVPAPTFRQISGWFLQLVQSVMDEFSKLETRCNDLLSAIGGQFPQMAEKLRHFHKICSILKQKSQKYLAKKLVLIRRGKAKEEEFEEMFTINKLKQWVDFKEQEMCVLKMFNATGKNIKILQSKIQLLEETGQMWSKSIEAHVCFVFTSLGDTDHYLHALLDYLKANPGEPPCICERTDDPWIFSGEAEDNMWTKAKLFRDFADANKDNQKIKFLAVGLTDDKHEGSTIYLYKDGFLVNKSFEPSSKPETVTATEIAHNSVTLEVFPPRFGAENITSYAVEFWVLGEDGWKQEIVPKSGEVTVGDLKPNTEYMFRCRAVTSVGVGPAHEVTCPIRTSPCSPPGEPQVQPKSFDVSVTWKKPTEIGSGVEILNYVLEYAMSTQTGDAGPVQWNQLKTKTQQETILDLMSDTEYAIRIRCDCGDAEGSRESETVVCRTSGPLQLQLQEILEDLPDLEARWEEALQSSAAKRFREIQHKLRTFKDLYLRFKEKILIRLHQSSPSGLNKHNNQQIIENEVKHRLLTPFNKTDLKRWMDYKEEEIQVLESLTDMMQNTELISSQNLYKEIIHGGGQLLCFVFTSLGGHDLFLSALSAYLNKTGTGGLHDVQKEQWFASPKAVEEIRRKAKLFSDFAEANKDNKRVKFLAVGLTDDDHEGSAIYLYEEALLINENFEPPSKPESVTAADKTHNSVTLQVFPPRFGADNLISCFVEVQVLGEDRWKQEVVPKFGKVTVGDLKPNTEYVFRCRAVTSVGVGPAHEITGPIRTLPCSPPGEPHVQPKSFDASITWKKPAVIGLGVQISNYILEFVETDGDTEDLRWKPMIAAEETAVLPGLRAETGYAVRIRCDCGEAGRSKESITSRFSTTRSYRAAELLRRGSEQIVSGSPSVYSLPLIEEDMNIDGYRKFRCGEANRKQNRTLVLLGMPGSGKSSLINGMINYVVGVEREDGFRFRLVEEDVGGASEVRVYQIHHQDGFRTDHSLTIVNTPELADAGRVLFEDAFIKMGFFFSVGKRGPNNRRDRWISKRLERLFGHPRGVREAAAVCLTVGAAHTRLSQQQRCEADSLLSTFSINMLENIRVLVTGSDGKPPPILESIGASGLRCPKAKDGLPVHFRFNESALYANAEEPEGFHQMFWNMETKNMKRFFDELKVMTTNDLFPVTEVIRERRELEKRIEELQKKIRVRVARLSGFRAFKETSVNELFINCQQCHMTCETSSWTAVTEDGFCRTCPGRCYHGVHFILNYRWCYEETGGHPTLNSVLQSVQEDIIRWMKASSEGLNRLKESYQRPDVISVREYMKLIQLGETREAGPGWEERVVVLRNLRVGVDLCPIS